MGFMDWFLNSDDDMFTNSINPANGLSMANDTIDIEGNIFGTDSMDTDIFLDDDMFSTSSFDDDDMFSSTSSFDDDMF